jgi:hypothetical protein
MKKMKNLFIALLTLVTFNLFSAPATYTVTIGVTTDIVCDIGDTLKFYGSTATSYGVSITKNGNSSMVVTPLPCLYSPYYIGKYVIVGGETSFTINSSVNWPGAITVNTVVIPTGISNINSSDLNELMAFPNPSNGQFKIKFNSNKEKNDVIIYDIQGRLVLENKDDRIIGKNELIINNDFASGIYIVRVENRSFKITIVR